MHLSKLAGKIWYGARRNRKAYGLLCACMHVSMEFMLLVLGSLDFGW